MVFPRGQGFLLGPPAVFLVFALGIPLAAMVYSSLLPSEQSAGFFTSYSRILGDSFYWDVFLTTIRISLVTTFIALLLGYPIAYFIMRMIRFKTLRRLCLILAILPLFTSNVIRSFAWMIVLGRTGIVNETLTSAGIIERPLRFLGTETGIVIGLTYILLPIVILNVANALAGIDPLLEQASSDLGARPLPTFCLIVLPLTMPSVISAAITVFALSMSAYVTPAILSGGKITVFPMLIFQQYGAVLDFRFGAALAVVLLVLTTLLTTAARSIAPQGALIR
jgi:putative spermidine/putrescine transport system permease protein